MTDTMVRNYKNLFELGPRLEGKYICGMSGGYCCQKADVVLARLQSGDNMEGVQTTTRYKAILD